MNVILHICQVIIALSILAGVYRLAKGPTVLDRIMGFDMVAICAVAFMVLLSIQWKTDDYLELILIFSLLGFSGTVAFVCYLGKNYHSDYDREKPPEGPNDR